MHFCHFNHRFSMQRVLYIAVDGDVTLSSITMGSETSAPPIAHPLPMPAPIHHPYPPSKVTKIVSIDKWFNIQFDDFMIRPELSRSTWTYLSSKPSSSSGTWTSSPTGTSSYAWIYSYSTTTALFSNTLSVRTNTLSRAQKSLYTTT